MNSWLKGYQERIEKMNYLMEESIQKGSFDQDIDLNEVLTLFRGSINEIKSLELKVNVLADALKLEKSKSVSHGE